MKPRLKTKNGAAQFKDVVLAGDSEESRIIQTERNRQKAKLDKVPIHR